MPDTTESKLPLRQRLGWFVLLYLAGLAAAGGAVFLLRLVLDRVYG